MFSVETVVQCLGQRLRAFHAFISILYPVNRACKTVFMAYFIFEELMVLEGHIFQLVDVCVQPDNPRCNVQQISAKIFWEKKPKKGVKKNT